MAITGKEANEWVKPLIYVTAAYVGWRYAISPLLEGLNLKDSAADVAADKVIQKTESAPPQLDYWAPTFHARRGANIPVKDVVKIMLPSAYGPYVKVADQIWDATGFWNDVESQIYAALRLLRYKTEVSYVASIFQSKYKRDLYQFLKAYLSKEEMATVLQITDKLPYGWVLKSGKVV